MLATLAIGRAGRHGHVSKIACHLSLKSHGKHVRGYAAVTEPVMNANADKGMEDLWKSYNHTIRTNFFSGNSFNPQSEKFFTPPMGYIGIAAGTNVPAPITNYGVGLIGDTLLAPNSPIFSPGSDSYIGRQLRYLSGVKLKTNTNAGAQQRLGLAEKKQTDLQAKMDDITTKAKAAYAADADKTANVPFRIWVSRNYPQYDSLAAELQEATNATNSAMIDVYGPGAAQLQRYITQLTHATDDFNAYPGLNMPVSEQLADIINGTTLDPNAIPEFRPLYTIGAGYSDQVKQWVANSDTASGTAKKSSFTFSTSDGSNKSWAESGFSNTGVSIGASYGFVGVRTTTDVESQHTNTNNEQYSAGLSATISANGFSTFDIKPGAWDTNFTKLYPPSLQSALQDINMGEMYAVSQVIMGYDVSLDITLGADAAKQMAAFSEQHMSTSVDVSIMGIPVSIGGHHEEGSQKRSQVATFKNNYQNINIQGSDNGYPVLLGVVGRKLPSMKK